MNRISEMKGIAEIVSVTQVSRVESNGIMEKAGIAKMMEVQ